MSTDLHRLQMLVYFLCICFLAMLGGTGIPRFMSYLLPWLVILLALVRPLPPISELVLAACMLFVYNRCWLAVPNPAVDVSEFTSFYGGHTAAPLHICYWRTEEMLGWILMANLFRMLSTVSLSTGKVSPRKGI